jgi:hypothetical protein
MTSCEIRSVGHISILVYDLTLINRESAKQTPLPAVKKMKQVLRPSA